MAILFLIAVILFVGVFVDMFVLDLFPSSWILPQLFIFTFAVLGILALWVFQAVRVRSGRQSTRRELDTITEEERVILKQFIHRQTLKSIKLDVSSETVQALEKKGLILPTTGIVFKGQNQEPSYKFYTMAEDVFKSLLKSVNKDKD